MTSKEIINKSIKEKKEMLEKAKKNKFKILAKQCEQDIEDYNKILKDLERLEAIDNANPSEALEKLKNIALSDLDSIPATAIPICEKYNEEVIKAYDTLKQALLKAQEQDKILKILKDKEVDVNFFKTLIPFHKEEDLMRKYNETRWKGKLTLEETIKIKEWLNGNNTYYI